jgi:cellulose synthase/poly-beta-1,6-N-acetylglucosamine synthase-like glycosyltransferase
MNWIYLLIGVYGMAMGGIFLYSLVQGHLLWQFLKVAGHHREQPVLNENDWPRVTVQLPIYNEKYVVERLLEAVAALDYPSGKLEIQVLDDSTDETTLIIRQKLSEYPHLDCRHIQRTSRQGFKAGALKEGLKTAKGDFIAIFDADFVPDKLFLRKTIPYFADKKTGMVQTRWTHLNKNYSLLTRLQAFALDAHFLVEQVGRNAQHAFINFNGTAGVWRKTCILEAGNWEADTLTEDLDLSYRAQKSGWGFLYLPEVASPAELPPVMSALKSQQYRWTKGGAECARKHLWSVLSAEFPLKTKVHATAHLLNSTIFIAILAVSLLSVPIWVLGNMDLLPPWMRNYGYLLMIGFVIISLVYFVANSYEEKKWHRKLFQFIWHLPLFLAVSMGMALHNSIAVWEGLTGKKTPFIRTPKFNLSQSNGNWKSNRYLNFNLPVSTYVEGGMALLFTVLVAVSFASGLFILLPFHLFLAVGYGLVFLMSYRSRGRNEM